MDTPLAPTPPTDVGDETIHYLVVRQSVADIPHWFADFSAATPARRAAGGGDPLVLIEDEAAGAVLVLIPFSSADAALAWRHRAGVVRQTTAAGVDAASVEVRVLRALAAGRDPS